MISTNIIVLHSIVALIGIAAQEPFDCTPGLEVNIKICDFNKPDYNIIDNIEICDTNKYKTKKYRLWKKSPKQLKIKAQFYRKQHFHCYSEKTFASNFNIYSKSLNLEEVDKTIFTECNNNKEDIFFENDNIDADNKLPDLIKDKKLIMIPNFLRDTNGFGYKSVYMNNILDYEKPTCYAGWPHTRDVNGHLCDKFESFIYVNNDNSMSCSETNCDSCIYDNGTCITKFYGIKWDVETRLWDIVGDYNCAIIKDNVKVICYGSMYELTEGYITFGRQTIKGLMDKSGSLFLEEVYHYSIDLEPKVEELYRLIKGLQFIVNAITNDTEKTCNLVKGLISHDHYCSSLIRNKLMLDHHAVCDYGVITVYPCIQNIFKVKDNTCMNNRCDYCSSRPQVFSKVSLKWYYFDVVNNIVTNETLKIKNHPSLRQVFAINGLIIVYDSCKISKCIKKEKINEDFIHPQLDFDASIFNNSELKKIDIENLIMDNIHEAINNNQVTLREASEFASSSNPIPSVFDAKTIFSSFLPKFVAHISNIVSTLGTIGGTVYVIQTLRRSLSVIPELGIPRIGRFNPTFRNSL